MKKKVLSILIAVIMVASLVPMAAFAAGNGGTNNNYVGGVGVKVDKNNANFHCNAFGGNGRVWPEEIINKDTGKITKHDLKKTPFMFYFDKVANTTKWTLNHVRDEKGVNIIGDVICPNCGSTQWISFSNNSGAPDGKNIQLQHPLTSIKIVKNWLDAEGNPSKGSSVKFEINYVIGTKAGKTTISPGTFDKLPAGTYVIKELDITNYTLVSILTSHGFVVDVAEKTATIVITPEMALADDKVTVTFTNQEDPYVIIDKKWADGNPGKIKAKFDIYKLGECGEECEEDCEIIHRGDLVKANAEAGVKYFLAEGWYVVAEQTKSYVKPAVLDGDGNVIEQEETITYVTQPDQKIEIKWGEIATVAFVNEPERKLKGELEIEKKITVDGETISIIEWLMDLYKEDLAEDFEAGLAKINAFTASMIFKLWEATEADVADGTTYGDFVRVGEFDLSGLISFGEVLPGWYAVTEEFTDPAAGFFQTPPVWYVQVFENGKAMISLTGHYEAGTAGGGFDYEAFYSIVNGYGGGYRIDYPGLNNTGDIFYIGVRNVETGDEYASFCANAGSTNFDENPGAYYVAEKFADVHEENAINGASYEDFLKAYNYIEATYGNLNDFRPVTQIITWYLLGAIEIPSAEFDAINWAAVAAGGSNVNAIADAKAIIEDVVANYQSFNGNSKIIDLVYMISRLNQNFVTAQPQLVPIYDGGYIVNKPSERDPKGGLDFNKTMFGGALEYYEYFLHYGVILEFEFDLFKYNAETAAYDIPVGTYATDFTGIVSVADNTLEIGKYVFIETFATFVIPGIGEYRFIWKPAYPGGLDGLYFEMVRDGDKLVVDWGLDEKLLDDSGKPSVDNLFWNKSNRQWVPIELLEEFTGMGTIGEIFEDGFVFYPGAVDAGEEVFWETTPATCTQGAMMWLYYSHADGSKGEPLMSIVIGGARGHGDWELNTMADGLRCGRCGWDRGWWELSDEELAIYHALGGLGGVKP